MCVMIVKQNLKGIILETEGTIKRELKKFMKSEKDEYTEGKNINVDAFFKEYKKY